MSASALALIPARGGSKGVPGKNIRPLGGFPVIAWSIVAARLCPGIDRVIVSTDSPEIAAVARRFGAETPFLRPAELATDAAGDRGVVLHLLRWLQSAEGTFPSLVVHLRPTTPLRDPLEIARAVAALNAAPQATALRSAHALPEPPQKMFGVDDGLFVGLFPHDLRPEYYNLPRQAFPPAYLPNGYVDVLRSDFVLSNDALHGPRILAHVTPPATEIDAMEDLDRLEYILERRGHPLLEHLRNFA